MQAIFLAYLPAENSSAVLKCMPQDEHDGCSALPKCKALITKGSDLNDLIERYVEQVSVSQSAPLSGLNKWLTL